MPVMATTSSTALASMIFCCLSLSSFVDCLIDNANLIWFEENSQEPQYFYHAGGKELPQELPLTRRVILNQRLYRLQPLNYSRFENLEELNIDFCKVKEVEPGAFDSLGPVVVTLTLRGNNIVDIDKGIFNDLLIETLNLSTNYISSIHPMAFDNMTNLKSLVLDYNQLKCWSSDWFQNTIDLTFLSFRHNLLEELPDNALVNFRGEIKNDTDISLDFGYNKIHMIHPRAFRCIGTMEVLNLEYNKLLMLKVETFRNVTRIKNLILKGNPLTCFPKELLQVILEKVDNPAI